MTALPPSTDFTGSSVTEGGFKTAITALRTFISELLGTSGTDNVAALTALGAILCDSLDKTGAYTVVAADKGKVLTCSGTFTLSLTAAATLGDAFAFGVWNTGSGTITIDPSGSELIDGATTKSLAAGKLAIVYCNGTAFVTVGSIATGSGSGLDADLLDGQHGSYYAAAGAVVPKDFAAGSYPVGMMMAVRITIGTVAAGATVSGTVLQSTYVDGALPGTWRNLSSYPMDASGTATGYMQRTA